MLIGELATMTGFSADTIRFYEKRGLIDGVNTPRRSNRYKEYSDATAQRLIVIRELKDLGFTLKEIQSTLQLQETNPESCVHNVPKIQAKLSIITSTIERLKQLQRKLMETKECCVKDCKNSCGLNKSLQKLSR